MGLSRQVGGVDGADATCAEQCNVDHGVPLVRELRSLESRSMLPELSAAGLRAEALASDPVA